MPMPLSVHVKELLRLAAPVIVARTGILTMAVVDVAFLGRVGAEQVAYMAIAGVALGTLIVGTIGLMIGTSVEASYALGAGRARDAGLVWRRSLPFAAIAGCIGAALCLCGAPLFRALGQAPDLAAGGGRVLAIMGLALPGTALFVTTTFFLEAIKRPVPGMVTILLANVLNAFLNWVFVLGNLGSPPLGAEGSALATMSTRTFMAIALIAYVLLMPGHDVYGVRERTAGWWRGGARARAMGYAAGVSYALEAAAFGSMSVFAGWLGAVELAAWSIALNAMALVFMTAVGLGVGAAVRVGHARGLGDRSGMATAGWVGLAACACAMGLASLAFLLLPGPIARLFTDEPNLVALATGMLVMGSWVMIVDGGQGAMLSVVRATGDAWVPTAMHFTAYFAVMIPLGWLFTFPLGFGATGLFLGILIASIVAVSLLSWRFWVRCRDFSPVAAPPP